MSRTTLWRRQWQPTPVLLSGKSHGQRILVGRSPWGREKSDKTEWLHFDFSLSCIGEGNGNPLQCSCLENPRDWGGWWAAVYGVAQSQTQLKQLSSSSNRTTLDPLYVNLVTNLERKILNCLKSILHAHQKHVLTQLIMLFLTLYSEVTAARDRKCIA